MLSDSLSPPLLSVFSAPLFEEHAAASDEATSSLQRLTLSDLIVISSPWEMECAPITVQNCRFDPARMSMYLHIRPWPGRKSARPSTLHLSKMNYSRC